MTRIKHALIAASLVVPLTLASLAPAWADAPNPVSLGPGQSAPTPVTPFPLPAAGWGPEVGNGVFYSRWAEDWTGMRAAGGAPTGKAIPLWSDASLTLSSETRQRYDMYDEGPLTRGNPNQKGLYRGLFGADLRFTPHLRIYGEIGTGQVQDRLSTATANFQNDASLQQLFLDVRGFKGPVLWGAMIGRQEFADGPRQMVSLSDGPNMRRTWNGVRLYAHGERVRVGAFELRATRQGRGIFDDGIDFGERLSGINASLVLGSEMEARAYLDPFWIHSENPNFRSGTTVGQDTRDTLGLRLWGTNGPWRCDWTVAHQSGRFTDRDIDAWGLFAVQSLALATDGWKPRLTARVDLASGGGGFGTGTLKAFNQLYASSNYLSEGQFLSLSNLVMFAPGITVSPTPTTSLSLEYGFALRPDQSDAAYAGGMRAVSGTQNVPGHEIGGLLRLNGSWAITKEVTVFGTLEHLHAGEVITRAGLASGTYGYIGTTTRF